MHDDERNKKLEAESQSVPIITKMFGETLPEMPEKEAEELRKMFPKIAHDDNKIYQEYLNKLVKNEINKNFNKIKTEVKTLIEREYERTTPLAEAYKATNGIIDD